MGAAASAGSDWVYVTSDNPRHEDPWPSSRPSPQASMAHTPLSRIAVEPSPSPSSSAKAGDIVLIAGKGHETTQTTGGVTITL